MLEAFECSSLAFGLVLDGVEDESLHQLLSTIDAAARVLATNGCSREATRLLHVALLSGDSKQLCADVTCHLLKSCASSPDLPVIGEAFKHLCYKFSPSAQVTCLQSCCDLLCYEQPGFRVVMEDLARRLKFASIYDAEAEVHLLLAQHFSLHREYHQVAAALD